MWIRFRMRAAVAAWTSPASHSSRASRRRAATGVVVGDRQESVVAVHNPSEDTVRVTATVLGGAADGKVLSDAVEIARAFKAAGADMIDCSSGQVSAQQKPTYGRMYQTPFADRIRNEVGVLTMAVGAISEADHANSIIAAGRADLCAVARPHLADPAWTLHEAAKLGSRDVVWPRAYESGRDQLYRSLHAGR